MVFLSPFNNSHVDHDLGEHAKLMDSVVKRAE